GIEPDNFAELDGGFAAMRRRFLAERNQHVAKEGTEGRDGLQHEVENGLLAGIGDIGLTEAEQVGAEFVFELDAMQRERNLELGEDIFAFEYPMAMLHVVKFDGEDIS